MSGRIVLGMAGPYESISFTFGAVTGVNWLTATKALSITGTHRSGATQTLATWTWSTPSASSATATYVPDGDEWSDTDGPWQFTGYLTLNGNVRHLRTWAETIYPR